MERFRVLSDLHLDINENYPITLDTDDFCLLCGDTAGFTEVGTEWISQNVKRGIIVCGNHLPYNQSGKTLIQQKRALSRTYPKTGDITYFDTDLSCWSKVVDGILFCGTCMYSDMKIKSRVNPSGDIALNKRISHLHINDYRYGIKSVKKDISTSGEARFKTVHITPDDYVASFSTAFQKLDAVMTKNEKKRHPLPIVLMTHYPLVRELIENSFYVYRDDFPSYGSDYAWWLKSHPSVKCYCCGHAHDIKKEYRDFYIDRDDGSRCLVVNNARGYVSDIQDRYFNVGTYVNVKNWQVERDKVPNKKEDNLDNRGRNLLAFASVFV